MWYTPSEVLPRCSLYLNCVTLSGAFGSLLASRIEKMDGMRGYSGWQWIFIIEGSATIIFSLVIFWWIPNFPERARWLSPNEKERIRVRLNAPGSNEQSDFVAELKNYLRSWRSHVAGILYLGSGLVTYSISLFLPTIVQGFHYSRVATQLHSVPPFAVAFAWSLGLALLVRRSTFLLRLAAALLSFSLVFVGLGILINIHNNVRTEYAGVILVIAGLFGAIPVIMTSYYMSLERYWQRAIGTAYVISVGNFGGIAATFSFVEGDKPFYRRGYSIMLSAICVTTACSIILMLDLAFQSRRPQAF